MTWVIKFNDGSYSKGPGHSVLLSDATQCESYEVAAIAADGFWGVEGIVNIGVHVTHCCAHHGCKYGDDDCPVFTGCIKQSYDCEECVSGGRLANENLANEAVNKIADLFTPGFFDDRMVNDVAEIVLTAIRKKTW